MSAFKFRLQQVLELREKQEMQSAAKLAEAETAADEARIAKTALESIQQSGARALHEAHAAEPTIGHLKTIGYVIDQLNNHIVGAQSRVDQAEQLVDKTRTELTSALQARRVLSRLRERHLASWRTEDNAQNMRQMDELALSRFTRRDDDDATDTAST
jgi:flagellar FliJ protein